MYRFTVEVPNKEIEVPIWGSQTVTVDLSALPNVARVKCLTYGIGRGLRDPNHPDQYGEYKEEEKNGRKSRTPVKSSKRTDAERKAIALEGVKETLARWIAGDFSERGAGRKLPADLKIAREYVIRACVKSGSKAKDVPAMPNMSSVEDLCKRIGLDFKLVTAHVAKVLAASTDVPEVELDLSKL